MTREAWDLEAATFDREPDHGLDTAEVRDAWRRLLLASLPATPARVADLGCGTGTLTQLLTEEGYSVDGVDFSPKMIERARAKAPQARLVVADVDRPPLAPGGYDVVLSRHLLWAMNDPTATFARWVALLKPGGIAVLIEGRWSTGAGLTAHQMECVVLSSRDEVVLTVLESPEYWGKTVTDERYLAVSRR